MSYAIRNDGQGWRAVVGPTDIGSDEWFSADTPPKPIPRPPTVEELTVTAKAKCEQLLASAANRMGPLQDAIDENAATDDEVATLKRWKQYRIALNRIEQQEGFPDALTWPVAPD